MIFVELDYLSQISGIATLSAILISEILALLILYKGIKQKSRILYLFFLCIFFTISLWYPMGVSYFIWLFTRNILDYQAFVILGTHFAPIAVHCWLEIYLRTVFPSKRKQVLICIDIVSVIFIVYVNYFLFIVPGAPSQVLLGVMDLSTPIKINSSGFVAIYKSVAILTAGITGMHFGLKSLEIKEDIAMVWKGRFILLGFLIFAIAAITDTFIQMNALALVINRIFLTIAVFFFYIGFILPMWMKNILSISD